MADTEKLLSLWAEPPSDTERTRCENAERVIKNAIKASDAIKNRDIRIFVQGSYQNSTNVRKDSDVDICVCLMDTFTTDYHFAPSLSDETLGISKTTYTYQHFKNDLEAALIEAFGKSNVQRGNKAFDIRENTYRVEADVVACIEHRRYKQDGSYDSGTSMFPDNGGQIQNWPHHHYDNGVWKNKETGYRFKRLVRIMKNLRNTMVDEGVAAARPIPSFFNECLVWNTPNHLIGANDLTTDVRKMLFHLWDSTESQEKSKEWGEINEMKYLFSSAQPWSREEARAWIHAAWNWLGFK